MGYRCIRVRLTNGCLVESAVMSDTDILKADLPRIGNVMERSLPDEKGFVSFNLPGHGWWCIPSSSILYVTRVGFGAVGA
jgi:hypothetical protein